MTLATVLFPGRDWWLPAVLLLAALLAGLVWTYVRAPARGAVRATCFVLKLLGFLALAACLLEPLWTRPRAKPGANFFALLADNSQGLQIRDRGETRTRGEQLRERLAPASAAWLAQLETDFQVRRYLFDTRLQGTRDFAALTLDGRATALGAALRTLRERFQGQPLAGVLLFSDGNATDLLDGQLDMAGLPPVYPVVLGRDEGLRDVALEKVAVSQSAFEDAPVTIQAEVTATGYAGSRVVAQLHQVSGQLVQEQGQRAPQDTSALTFRFQLRSGKGQVQFYHLRVGLADEPDVWTKPETSTEATLVNNRRAVAVDAGGGPYRVLYFGGRPNWEFKFLNRAVAGDDQIEMVAVIRVARREPRFEFRGRQGESNNPLFRGFDRQTEETERYDQPVLVRLNTRDAAELAGGFPKTAEALYEYHALVLDDLEAEFFTHDQRALIQKFVAERGGGFLMLGGVDTFQAGKYERTPVGDMLPVYLDRPATAGPLSQWRLTLTREGWLQPWMRLRQTEAEERSRLDALPPFQVLSPVRQLKPGASVLATVTDAGHQTHPALAVQRFGHGRVGALLIGDLWRAGLQRESLQRDLEKAWRQLIRWLVAEVPQRVELLATRLPADVHGAIQLQARARDPQFQPLDGGSVTFTIRNVSEDLPRPGLTNAAVAATPTNGLRLAGEPALTEPGLYETTFVPRQPGGYLAEAVVHDPTGVQTGRAQAGWTSDPLADEFHSLRPNRALLETLARKTGGEIVALDQLDEFVERLPRRTAPITESWAFPLWHQPAVFIFALACFVAEWGIRRWKGLA
jgi:hypothetical protein